MLRRKLGTVLRNFRLTTSNSRVFFSVANKKCKKALFESQGFPRECKKCLEVIDVTYCLRNIFLCKPNFFLTLINERYFNIWNITFAKVFLWDTFERWSLLNDKYVRVKVINSHLQLHFVNKIFVLSSDLEGLENPIPYSNLLIDSRIV